MSLQVLKKEDDDMKIDKGKLLAINMLTCTTWVMEHTMSLRRFKRHKTLILNRFPCIRIVPSKKGSFSLLMAWDGLDAVKRDQKNTFYGLKFSAHTKDDRKR